MSGPTFILAHGAGAGQSHRFMVRWRAHLETLGAVVAFEYPYMAEGKRRPDRMPTLLAAHRAVWADARSASDGPIFLVGKSMGSRVGCHLANEPEVDAAGLVCFGYPLVGSGKRRAVRDEVLKALRTPILFIQGTRDRLCPLDHLEAVRGEMVAPSELHVVESGDHSLDTTRTWQKATSMTQDDADEAMFLAIRSFVEARS